MAVQFQRRRFTVDDYYQMARAGILKPDDRVELIDGEIVQLSPIGSPHATGVTRVTNVCYGHFTDRAVIRVQNPVHLDGHSEPEPDVALLRPRDDLYASGHPGPADVLLIIEVADTSSAYDRRVKLPLYARFGIPETWLLLVESADGTEVSRRRPALEVHRGPSLDGYKEVRRLRRGQRIAPLAFPDVEIAVDDLLGQ
jgi:Uma2 family endonuclease